jgi:hypothetical protein
MALINNNHGKFFSPAQSYMGYVFIACGIFTCYYSLNTLFLIIPGGFLAFTYTGTLIDTDLKRVKPYTAYFGIFKSGKWIATNQFSRFKIIKSNRTYTSYSRGGVRLDINNRDLRLILLKKEGKKSVVVNVFSKLEDAQREMEELNWTLMCNPDNI